MERLRGSKPSPAMVVSIIALVFALAGSAAAGVATISVLSKKEKKQTRNIAKDEIKKAAPGLSVANATNAQTANALSGVGSVRASQLAPIVRRVGQFSGAIPANTGFSVSADCDPGEVPISGGVDVGNSFTTHTVESRRLDADSWVVVVQTNATNPDTATAEVYCLQE